MAYVILFVIIAVLCIVVVYQSETSKSVFLSKKHREEFDLLALQEKIKIERANEIEKFEEFLATQNRLREQIEQETAVFKRQRDLQVRAAQQEEKRRQQVDFFKLQLSPAQISDLQQLEQLKTKFSAPQILAKLQWSEIVQPQFKLLWSRIGKVGKVSGIYKITNLTNQKTYVGQSVDVQTRLSNHLKASLGISSIAHQVVHDAIKEEGLQNFSFEVLAECAPSELNTMEKMFINTYQSNIYGYNMTKGGS